MEIAPEEYLAKKVEWQFFATLTFRGNVPKEEERTKMLFAWVAWWKHLQTAYGKSPSKVNKTAPLWMLREELGEITGRFHYHLLLGGLSQNLVVKKTAMASCARWEKLHGGMARNYIYAPHLDGVAYVLKGLSISSQDAASFGAINYEMGKFKGDEGSRVLLGHSLVRLLLTRKSNRRLVTAKMMRAHQFGS